MISTAAHLLAFVVAFCLLVTVHEFGHFWVARRLGFKVLRFSVGFGKPLWKRAGADGTEYWISSIPLGGYVKMVDEREGPVAAADLPRAFTRRPHWQRILVLLAGPGFNILFAVLVLTGILYASGITQYKPVLGHVDPGSIVGRAGLASGDEITAIDGHPTADQRAVQLDLLDAISASAPVTLAVRTPAGVQRTVQLAIAPAERLRLTEPDLMASGLGLQFYSPPVQAVVGAVVHGGPAARAGLEPGDRILAVNGEPVHNVADLQTLVRKHPNESITIRFGRGDRDQGVRLTPTAETVDGQHFIGIGIEASAAASEPYPAQLLRHIRLSLPAAFVRANVEAWDVTALQGRMIWRMLLDRVSIKNLSGPLSIAEYAGAAAAEGVSSFLSFLVLLSLALGFMNLLPIPILDGGQILFQAIEWLKGSPLSERFQVVSQQVGLALLFLLMGVALFNDISQFG